MKEIKITKKDENSFEISLGSQSAGLLRAYVTRPGNNQFYCPWPCSAISVENDNGGFAVEFRRDDEDITAALELDSITAGFAGKFNVTGKGCAIVRLVWELPRDRKGFPFVPAFMYGFNEGGQSPDATYPQLDNGSNNPGFSKPWVDKQWLVRADRSSHCLSSIITDEYTCAVGGRDVCRYADGTVAEKNGLGISSDPYQISFSVGFANAPYTYSVVAGRNFYGRPEGYINLDKGGVESEFFLFLFETRNRHKAASRLLRQSYDLLHDDINDAGTVEDAVIAVSGVLVQDGYNEQAKNFYTTLYEDDRPEVNIKCEVFGNGWTGGSRTAYPILVAGHQLNRPQWVDCARDILSNIAENAINEQSGLFYENYNTADKSWTTDGWWSSLLENQGHSSYVNGHICHYLLKGYLLEKQIGKDFPQWLKSARKVLDHIADVQGGDGRFGYIYDENDGTILDPVGFAGCWFVPAFANLYRITKDKRYLNVAERAMDFYRNDVKAFHVYGCPHDIWKSPDEEGILAWIEAAKILHEVTEEEQFLDDLLAGLDYEFSWKFAYNVVNEVEPLKGINWCSTGGSVTSVNNSHIHPMGSAIAPSILYAYQQTRDEYWKSRLIDTVRWSLTVYIHNDGDYGWGRKGLINERFCYTDSLLNERFADGSPASTWFCGHSWASGAVLEGLVGDILEMEKTAPEMILGK